MSNRTSRILHISTNILAGLAILLFGGCVERLITVETEPAGAVVWLNGEEAGITPMTVRFQEYGEYEVLLRKPGYDTIRQNRIANPPLYQWPGLDLVSECLLPTKFVDEHKWEFQMTASQPTDPESLVQRAALLRGQAVSQH